MESYVKPDLTGIPAELLVWFENHKSKKIIGSKQIIYYEGETALQFYYLKKGRVKIFVTSEHGGMKTLTIYKENHIFGEAAFFDGMPRTTSAVTMEKCELVVINKEGILKCFHENPSLALSMITSLSKTVRMLSTQINHISFLSAHKRVAQFLLGQISSGNHKIVCSHEELGLAIGNSRITVNRILNEFRKNEWIELSYRTILVNKADELLKFLDSDNEN